MYYRPSMITILVLFFSIFYYFYNSTILLNESKTDNNRRYLFYDINPYEGFNLRRDVYMRIAILGHRLNKSTDENLRNFRIVLPPWSRLVHWGYNESPEQIPWSYYFDLESLQKFAPVIELYQFFNEIPDNIQNITIDNVYILQHFADMFETGNFEERIAIENCQKPFNLNFFYYSNITSNNITCLSYHNSANGLEQVLRNSTAYTILFHHAEVALHEYFGGKLYWKARRSMRFNKHLRNIANEFRGQYLNSFDSADNTELPEDWRLEKPKRNASGGPYIAIHLRRRDFLRSHLKSVPHLSKIADQVTNVLQRLKLDTVFVATDAADYEYNELVGYLSPKYNMFRYKPTSEIREKYKDGGVAIIDQIICSYARYFIGTQESTFSFRIHEEREIIGFPTQTTFNSFCGDTKDCPKPTVWKIVY